MKPIPDAVQFFIDSDYKQQAQDILNEWQEYTGFELEEDNVVKLIARDVNNYAEIVQVGEDDYEVHYKGGELTRGEHEFKYNQDKKTFEYSFKDSLKSNSMSIVSEALLKFLLFDIPIEKTIYECNDIFRFQIISHLGSTYEKCVQESLNNNIDILSIQKLEKELTKLEKQKDNLYNKTYKLIENEYDDVDMDEFWNTLENNVDYKDLCKKTDDLNIKISSLNHCDDIELQRNNRIYAGLKPSGNIVKIKSNGRRDSLANCPPNPVVDNANQCSIEDINKQWYIDFTIEKANDFLGIKRLEDYKKDELLELAKELNIDVDKKTKKEELIKIIKNNKKILTNNLQYVTINKEGDNEMATKQELEEELKQVKEQRDKSLEQNEKLVEKLKNGDNMTDKQKLLYKINEFRKKIREREFILDKSLPDNLGGNDYYKIDQFYNAVQDICVDVGLDFSFQVTDVLSFDKDMVKPSGRLPIHVATVKALATLTDIDTGDSKEYITIGQGSDTIDKAITGAGTIAFRHWFFKNFTPKDINEYELDNVDDAPKSEPPKTPVYIPKSKKEEIKKEVVAQKQQEADDEDIKAICENIMKIRAVGIDENGKDLSKYGEKTLALLMSGESDDATIMEFDLKVKNKMEKVGLI